MKTRIIIIMAIVGVLVLPTALYAQETDQVATLKIMETALNAGDVDAAMALFTNDAVINLNFFGDTYTGAAEIRVWFEELAAENFELQLEILQIDGDTVTTKTTTWIDFTREMEIAPLVAEEVYTFQNGKISGFTWTPYDETVTKIQSVMPPEALPETGDQTALHSQAIDPAAVVAALYEAYNAGDVDAITALYADDAAIYFPDDDETLTGEELHSFIEWIVSENFAIEAQSVQVNGNTVTLSIKTWADPTRELGVAPLEATDVYVVKDGKIASQTSAYTKETNARIEAALATLPETGGVTFPIHAAGLALGGLAILGGTGLVLKRRRSL